MRWSSPLAASALLMTALVGCGGGQHNATRAAVSKPPPFVEWTMPQEQTVAHRDVVAARNESPCEMWFDSTYSGIAIMFAPRGGAAKESVRGEVRQLASALRAVQPFEREPNAGTAVARQNTGTARAASAGGVTEQAATEAAAGSVQSLDPAPGDSEAVPGAQSAPSASNEPVDASRVSMHGVRQIMELRPDVAAEYSPEGARLVLSTKNPGDVEKLRARVRWHAAELVPSATTDPKACIRVPGMQGPLAAAPSGQPAQR